jgi:alpha-mannosidase
MPTAQSQPEWRVQPTPLLTRDTPAQRLLEVHFPMGRAPRQAQLQVRVGEYRATMDLGLIHPGDTKAQFLVPEVAAPTAGEARLTLGEASWQGEFTLAPARPWTVYVVPHSHTDIGFTHTASEVAAIHDDNTDEAVALCEMTQDWPEGARFKWTCEVSWQLQNYIRNRPPEALERLRALLRSGQMEVAAFYAGVHTDLCGVEELIRSLYFGAELRRSWDISVDTVMIVDIPGATWPFAQIMAKAGVKYLIISDNNFIAPFLRFTDVPRPFYWAGPEGSQVLSWYTDEPQWVYIEGTKLGFDKGYTDVLLNLPDKLVKLEQEGYPYDAYQVQFASDNCRVIFRPSLIVREWQNKWANPQIKVSTAREFFQHIEANHAPEIPVRRGDWTSWWAGTAVGFARESAQARHIKEDLAAAEKLSLWLAATTGAEYPREQLVAAYDDLLVFDEHSGTKGLAIPKTEERQLRALYEGYGYIQGAATRTEEALQSSLNTLAAQVANDADEPTVLVANPLSWERSDLVETTLPEGVGDAVAVVDPTSGQALPSEPAGSGRVRFVASDVPACGYKAFHLRAGGAGAGAELRATPQGCENAFYQVTIDPRRGVCRVVDKALDWALVDEQLPFALGALVGFQPKPTRKFNWEAGTFNYPELYDGTPVPGELVPLPEGTADVSVVSAGPLSATVRLERDAGPVRWRQEWTLYAGIKRVDVANTIIPQESTEQEGQVFGQWLGYFVWPFQLSNPRFRLELPGALLTPEVEQLKGGCRDFWVVQHWAAVYNDDYSIVLSAPDTPIWEMGRNAPSLQQYYPQAVSESAMLWARAFHAAGRKGSHESPFGRRDPLDLRFSLTTQAGALDPLAAAHHGWGTLNPLLARPLPPRQNGALPGGAYSWCQVVPANVLLVTAKQAEDGDGYILRLWEATGQDTEVTLSLDEAFGPFSAWQTSIVEEDRAPLSVRGRSVTLPIAGFGLETVRIRPGE